MSQHLGSDVAGFETLLNSMAQVDFFTGILPFVISYVFFYVLLLKLPIWPSGDGEGDQGALSNVNANKFSALLAVALSLYVSYFIVQQEAYQTFFADFFGRIIIGILGIVGLLMLLAMVGVNLDDLPVPILIAVGVLFAISAFGISGGLGAFIPADLIPNLELGGIGDLLFDTGLIWIIVVAATLLWVTGSGESPDPNVGWWFGIDGNGNGNGGGNK